MDQDWRPRGRQHAVHIMMKFLMYLLSNIGGNWDNMLRGPQHIIIIPTLVVATITQCGATSRSDAYLPLCIPTPYGLIFGGCGDHLS